MLMLRLAASAHCRRLRLRSSAQHAARPPSPGRPRLITRSGGAWSAALLDGTVAGNADAPLAASGYCAACATTHSLPRSAAADAAAAELLLRIRSTGRLDFDADVADPRFAVHTKYRSAATPRAQGQMLGVLLAEDARQHTHVLKAFSGQMNGAWLVPGWAPPLGSVRHDSSPVYTLAWRRIAALGAEAAQAQADAAALAGGPRGMRKGWTSDPELAALQARREKAKAAQRAASRALLTRIWDSYTVRNFKGESTLLVTASLLGEATRGGTGDCCAPKLLHAAQTKALRPLSMAEVWFGSPPPSGGRVEGQAYAACEERCQPLLGYMLCGLH